MFYAYRWVHYYQPQVTLTETLVISDIPKKLNLIIVSLDIVLKKIMTNTPSHGTQFDVDPGNRTLAGVQPTD